MEALILLLISTFFLSLYGGVYVIHRLFFQLVEQEERNRFKQSFFVLSLMTILSGLSTIFLFIR